MDESPLLGFRGQTTVQADTSDREKLRRGLGVEKVQDLRVIWIDDLPVIETERMILRVAEPDETGKIVRYLLRNKEHLRPWEPKRDDMYFTEKAWEAGPDRDRHEARTGQAYRFRLMLKPASAQQVAQDKAAINRRTLNSAPLGADISEMHRLTLKDEYMGTISLRDIREWPGYQATIGYSLDHSVEGQGLMREGVAAVIRFGFGLVNLRRIEACFMPANDRSRRLLTGLGFEIEGLLRSSLEVDGKWEDHHICSLINHNWRRP